MKRAVKSYIFIAAVIALSLCFWQRAEASEVELWDEELSDEDFLNEELSEDDQEEVDAWVEQYFQELDMGSLPSGMQEFERITDPEISTELTEEGKLLSRFPNQGYFISTVPDGMLSSQPVELSISSGCVAIIEHNKTSQPLTSSRQFTQEGAYVIRILSYQAPGENYQAQDYALYETSLSFTILGEVTSRIGAVPAPEGFQIRRVTRDGKDLPVENPRCFFLTRDGSYTVSYAAKENALEQATIGETAFTLDTTAPFLSFSQELENGELASGMLEFYPSEENCRIYMSYNGEQGYAVSNQLTVAGYYRLEIEDEAGNRREYHLRIRPSYHLFDARIIIAGILFRIVVAVWMMMQRRNMQVL